MKNIKDTISLIYHKVWQEFEDIKNSPENIKKIIKPLLKEFNKINTIEEIEIIDLKENYLQDHKKNNIIKLKIIITPKEDLSEIYYNKIKIKSTKYVTTLYFGSIRNNYNNIKIHKQFENFNSFILKNIIKEDRINKINKLLKNDDSKNLIKICKKRNLKNILALITNTIIDKGSYIHNKNDKYNGYYNIGSFYADILVGQGTSLTLLDSELNIIYQN